MTERPEEEEGVCKVETERPEEEECVCKVNSAHIKPCDQTVSSLLIRNI